MFRLVQWENSSWLFIFLVLFFLAYSAFLKHAHQGLHIFTYASDTATGSKKGSECLWLRSPGSDILNINLGCSQDNLFKFSTALSKEDHDFSVTVRKCYSSDKLSLSQSISEVQLEYTYNWMQLPQKSGT